MSENQILEVKQKQKTGPWSNDWVFNTIYLFLIWYSTLLLMRWNGYKFEFWFLLTPNPLFFPGKYACVGDVASFNDKSISRYAVPPEPRSTSFLTAATTLSTTCDQGPTECWFKDLMLICFLNLYTAPYPKKWPSWILVFGGFRT